MFRFRKSNAGIKPGLILLGVLLFFAGIDVSLLPPKAEIRKLGGLYESLSYQSAWVPPNRKATRAHEQRTKTNPLLLIAKIVGCVHSAVCRGACIALGRKHVL